MKLLLFDIDGTLVLSGGAGARGMIQAFEDVFGDQMGTTARDRIAEVPMAGRTDTWIVAEMTRIYGLTHDAALLKRFHDTYITHLVREIHLPAPRKGVLPGVREAVDALSRRDDVHLALLTGNFEEGARVKLEYFDLWRYFSCGAFAEDSPDRNRLFKCAVDRVRGLGGPAVEPADVVIIGDTPHDVGVALAAGARSLAVATGSFSREELLKSGADVALDDLRDLPAVLAALGLETGS